MKRITGLSAAVALLFGAAAYLLLAWLQVADGLLYALLAAALMYLVLSVVLRICMGRVHKRYTQIEQELTLEYFHKSNGNFDLGGGNVKNGNLYFRDDGIVCLSLDTKPYAMDVIERAQIARMDFEDIHLRIHTWDGRRYILTLPDAEAVRQLLRDRNWQN